MRKFRDIKIGTKIVLSFIAVIILVIVMVLVTQMGLNSIRNDMQSFYEDEFQIVNISQTVKTDLQTFAKTTARMALASETKDNITAAEVAASLETATANANDALTQLDADIKTLSALPLQSQDESVEHQQPA